MKRTLCSQLILLTLALPWVAADEERTGPTQSAEPPQSAETEPASERVAEVTEVNPGGDSDPRWRDDRWGIVFATIPDILRLHCPPLRGEHGLLVAEVEPESAAARFGLRAGDVLLESRGRRLTDPRDLPAPAEDPMLLILRHGHLRPLLPRWPRLDPFAMPHPELPPPPALGPRFGFGGAAGIEPPRPHRGWDASSSASVSRSSGESRALAVSRAGDLVTIEYSSPLTEGETVRFQGTVGEIEQRLKEVELAAEAKREIRRAIPR